MDHFPSLIGMVKNILYYSKMIILDTHTYFLYMKSLNHWMCSKHLWLKLKINSRKELRMSNMTVAMNITADMTVQVNNIYGFFPNT